MSTTAMVVALGLVCGLIAHAVGRPFYMAHQMSANNAEVRREILELQQENQRLEKEARMMNTPQGKELVARRMGYVRKREVPLVIPQ